MVKQWASSTIDAPQASGSDQVAHTADMASTQRRTSLHLRVCVLDFDGPA